MKRCFYFIYAVFFNICRIFPLKQKRVAFLSPHNADFNDSLGEVMREIEKKDMYDIVKISRNDISTDRNSSSSIIEMFFSALKFFTVKAFLLATSKYVFLNDNFMPMGSLKFSKNAVITQLWHAEGVFKKFGLHIDQPPEIRKREIAGNKKLSYVVCSSGAVAPIYAEAFGVDIKKVLPLGSARTDCFFKDFDYASKRAELDEKYPNLKGKVLVLYAPTFRDNPEEDALLLDNIDVNAFNERFGDTHALLVRLHPQVHTDDASLSGAADVTEWKNVSELMMLCDILITDYSSICMDFALLKKPVYFYAYDLEKYASERSFYFDYASYVPGPVTKEFSTLLNLINSNISETFKDRMEDFREFNFDNPNGGIAKRIVERIIENN